MTPAPLPLDEQLRDVAMLSIPQAAELWGVSEATIYRMLRQEELRYCLIGVHDRRIPLTEMRAWVERHLAYDSPTAQRTRNRPVRRLRTA